MTKRIPVNKIQETLEQKKIIRKMFFQKRVMLDIESHTNLTERVIRRVVRENNYDLKRERYWRNLCFKSNLYDIPLKEISISTGVSYNILTRIKRKYKLDTFRGEPWNKMRNKDVDLKIIQEYKTGVSGNVLSGKYGYKTSKTIYDILCEHGVDRRPPKMVTYYDEKFFEKINSFESAYFLGILMADGSIKGDYLGVNIQLTEDDGYILEKMSELIGANKTHGLQKIDYSPRRKTPQDKARDMLRLTISNRKIAEDLKKLGVVRNKTKILEYNNVVPKKFHSAFFRGLLDGDGSVGINSQTNYPWCHICSTASEKFAIQISSLYDQLSINMPNKKFWVVRAGGGKKKIYDFIRWIYQDKDENGLYLRRKYEKVQDQIN